MKLKDSQLKQLADFTSNLSLVFFASVLTPMFSGVDTINLFSVVLGLIAAVLSLITSLLLIKRT